MEIEHILKYSNDELEKFQNIELIKIFNFLGDNIELIQNELKKLSDEIENVPIEDDFFKFNIKKQEYKNKGLVLLTKMDKYMDMQNKIFKILTKRTEKI